MRCVSEDSQWPVLDDLVGRVVSTRRQIAAAQAAEARMLFDAVELIADRTAQLRQAAQQAGRRYDSSADLPLREVSLELGMAMRMSDRTVQTRISEAFTLVNEFPRTFDAWSAGDIDAGHAWGISRVGILLTDEAARARYEELALVAAATESPARMTQAAKAIAATICPEAFAELARAASEERAVRLYELPEGMARIIADLPASLAHAILDRLTEMAKGVLRETDDAVLDAGVADSAAAAERAREADTTDVGDDDAKDASTETVITGPSTHARPSEPGIDPRGMDQLRADLLCDLLLAGAPAAHGRDGSLAAIKARIQVTVPAATLRSRGVSLASRLVGTESSPIPTPVSRSPWTATAPRRRSSATWPRATNDAARPGARDQCIGATTITRWRHPKAGARATTTSRTSVVVITPASTTPVGG